MLPVLWTSISLFWLVATLAGDRFEVLRLLNTVMAGSLAMILWGVGLDGVGAASRPGVRRPMGGDPTTRN